MLIFADSAWEIISCFLIFCAGIWVAFCQKRFFGIPGKQAIALYLWHTFFCIFYFQYSLNNTADSTLYYLNSLDYQGGFKPGTQAIYYFVAPLSQDLELSYGGIFLLFNIFGYIGLLALAAALREVTRYSTRSTKQFVLLVLFLPGLSFWSSALGKDSLTFLGAGLASWAALNIRRRAPIMAIAVLAFLIPRPHMAAILLASLALALFFSSGIRPYLKIILVVITLPAAYFAAKFGLQYVGLGSSISFSRISEYVSQRQSYNLGGGSSVDIASMSIPMRMFTYLFRPLFFDAGGLTGLVTSIENMVLLIVVLSVVSRIKRTRSVLGRFQKLFFAAFIVVTWLILANTTANLGIAIRHKIMFLPMLIVLLFSYKGRKLTYNTSHTTGEKPA